MFTNLIEALIFASVGTAAVRTYLTVNKVWTRKTDKNVAESISVFASILSLMTWVPFFISYAFIDADYKSAANMLLAIILSVFLLLIGSGVWVADKKMEVSFWTKFKRAMTLEKDEAGDLVKAFISPKGANLIIEILYKMAQIDQVVDEKEIHFIQTFAKSWRLDFDPEKMDRSGMENSQSANYMELRNMVTSYVEIVPPPEQAAHLRDVITSLANIDNDVSEEEAIILEEINGILDAYVSQGDSQTKFQVVIAPQNDDQADAIKELVPNFVLSADEGGVGYIVGNYYSETIARMVCQKYRSLDLFTAIEKREPTSAQAGTP